MLFRSALEAVGAEAVRFLEEEGLGEHAEEGREGIEGLRHVVLQVLGRALWPDEQAHYIGDEGADDDDERDLHERL